MATQFTPFFQAIDGNGNPIAGAKLYWYRTGTSTFQNTYSDSGLTSVNANPVIANADGRFPPIYFGSAYDYKGILRDASDVTVGNGTVDPIFASSFAGRTAVADASYALAVSDRLIAYTSLTAARSVSLLPAATYEAGALLTIVDESGSASGTNTISVVPDGSDTIDGANATRVVINVPYGSAMVESDGASKWTRVKAPELSIMQQIFATSGTYTPTAGMAFAVIEALGAGGGGGGTPGTGANITASGGGGGAGSLSTTIATAADIGASQTVTIGGGGSAGAGGGGTGGTGGDTSVGSLCVGKGGSGGGSNATGGLGGGAGTGDTTPTGMPGANGAGNVVAAGASVAAGGAGGSSKYGGGGRGGIATNGNASTGSAGTGKGSGGGGAACSANGTGSAGSAGADGYVVITEYVRT